MESIFFRLKYIAKSVGLDGEPPIIFRQVEPEELSVELRPISDDEYRHAYAKSDLMCVAFVKRKPTRAIQRWLSDPSDPIPAGFREFSDSAFDCLADAVVRALKLLRWRVGLRNERNPIRWFHAFQWSSNSEAWHAVPDAVRLRIDVGLPVSKISNKIVESTTELWLRHLDEPLAHELFQEAWGQQNDNPKSSLVIGIAAAETCVKHLVLESVPAASWLIKNTNSPPLVLILREYLPQLPTRITDGKVLAPPDWLVETILKGVTLRNKIVHGQVVTLKPSNVREILQVVNDLLYYCDLLAGHAWAANQLSHRFQLYLKGEA